jgi:diamine N-acetyltransferase
MTGQNVFLRALEPTDIDFLYKVENEVSLWHLSSTTTPFSRFVLEQYLLTAHDDIFSTKQLRLAIEEKSPEKHQGIVGLIDLYDFDPHNLRAGTGIIIDEKYRGLSYATEALQLLIDYAFNTLQLKQLYAGIPAQNTASIKLFLKAGFLETGSRQKWIRHGENWLDENFYQIIKE